MIDKIKAIWAQLTVYASLVFLAVIGILSALLLRQNKKTAKVESELAVEKTNEGVIANDKDREQAKKESDSATLTYDKLRSMYDENRTGGGS